MLMRVILLLTSISAVSLKRHSSSHFRHSALKHFPSITATIPSSNANTFTRQFAIMPDTVAVSPVASPLELFDKSRFNRELQLLALSIPVSQTNEYMKRFKEFALHRVKTKRVLDIPSDNGRKLLLLSDALHINPIDDNNDPSVSYQKISKLLPPNLIAFNTEHGGIPQYHTLQLGYNDTPMDEVLRALLPSVIADVPSSFEQAGTIAHLNLRDEALPYKNLIGQVILDKVPTIKTVVNKVGSIETEFRTFPMELIAGVDDYNVTLKESGARFQFNFGEVYWNSRLQMEHARLIDLIIKTPRRVPKRERVVADMMAGIGPFSVPLAMQKIEVYANDLNPASYKYLVNNANINNCTKSLKAYNMDGRDFILRLLDDKIYPDEVLMNLPQTATNFLDVFVGYSTRIGIDNSHAMPRIHVHAFSSSDDPIQDVIDRVAQVLQCDTALLKYHKSDVSVLPSESLQIPCFGHLVRDVAPKKMMVCVTFLLPSDVANAKPIVQYSSSSCKRNAEAVSSSHIDSKKMSRK